MAQGSTLRRAGYLLGLAFTAWLATTACDGDADAAGSLVMFQQMGFGLAVVVLLDATIVRSVLVPASMRFLGAANWYMPSWLGWLPELRAEGSRAQPAQSDVAWHRDSRSPEAYQPRQKRQHRGTKGPYDRTQVSMRDRPQYHAAVPVK